MNEFKIGQTIGKLIILSFSYTKSKRPAPTAVCKCECGKIITLPCSRFKKTRSCGCTWHHKSGTKAYYSWAGMKDRCYDITNKEYHNYGGRGVFVCEGLHSFNHFYKTIGEPPSSQYSNDRINNDKNYTCGQCSECQKNKWELNIRWATVVQQAQNKRSNVYIDFNGTSTCLSEVARRINIPQSTLWMRIFQYKWDVDRAIKTPLNKLKC